MRYSFCKIYLSTSKDISQINFELNTALKLTQSNAEFYVDENEEYDTIKELDFPDGFLYFKFIVDINFSPNFSKTQCIEIIDKILFMFWTDNISAIAVYDFEHELIKNGGYKSKEIPWPK